jgi:hypothetical protein
MKLTQLIAQYVEFRRGMGQTFVSDEGILRAFSRAVGEDRHIRHVTAKEVTAFLWWRRPRNPKLAPQVHGIARFLPLCPWSWPSVRIALTYGPGDSYLRVRQRKSLHPI